IAILENGGKKTFVILLVDNLQNNLEDMTTTCINLDNAFLKSCRWIILRKFIYFFKILIIFESLLFLKVYNIDNQFGTNAVVEFKKIIYSYDIRTCVTNNLFLCFFINSYNNMSEGIYFHTCLYDRE
ncbi:hypothetical protein ACJX0J_029403, partial [Zea mays]